MLAKLLLDILFHNFKGSGAAPVRFNGQDLYQPGSYSKRNASAAATGGVTGSTMLVIGQSDVGIPFSASADYPNANDRVNWITGAKDYNVLEAGDAFDAIRIAMTGVNDARLNPVKTIGYVRVDNKATTKAGRSSTSISNSASAGTPAAMITLKSKQYGVQMNNVWLQIAAASDSAKETLGYKNISTGYKYPDNDKNYLNVGYIPFTVVYSGSGTTAVMVIDVKTTKTLTTTIGTATTDGISLSLSAYATMKDLTNAITANGKYTVVLDPALAGRSPLKLDDMTSTTIFTNALSVRAHLMAFEDLLDAHPYITYAAAATPLRSGLAVTAKTFFTAGTDGGTAVAQDWLDAIDFCQQIDASFIHLCCSDSTIGQAAASYLGSHCVYMNNSSGLNERQGIWGSVAADTTDAAKTARAVSLNQAFLGFYATEHMVPNAATGVEQSYPGYICAGLIPAISAGNEITTAPTQKTLAYRTTETYSPTRKDNFIANGCIISDYDKDLKSTVVIRSVTTYQQPNIILNEWSAVRTILFITKDHRTWMKSQIGTSGNSTQLGTLDTMAKQRLRYYAENNLLTVDPAKGNAFRGFTSSITADHYQFEYEGTIPLPVNFVFGTHNFTVIGF